MGIVQCLEKVRNQSGACLEHKQVTICFFNKPAITCTASELKRHKDNPFGYFLAKTRAEK